MRPSPSWLAALAALSLAACYVELSGSSESEHPVLVPDGGPSEAGALDASFTDGRAPDDAAPPGDPRDASPAADDSGLTIDVGDAAALRCDGVAVGTSESRSRFAEAQVVPPDTCKSEPQTRVCEASGHWGAWTGSYQAEQCSVSSVRSCGSTPHGASVKRQRYVADKVSDYSLCSLEVQTATCSDGTLSAFSGSAQFDSCQVRFLGRCGLLLSDVACEATTECALRFLTLQCVGSTSHACGANNECSYTCVGSLCTSAYPPRGAACDDTGDCLGCLGSLGQGIAAYCVANVCACGNGGFCSANNQCVGTCAASQCVPVNTSCDKDDDCRGEYKCIKPSGGGAQSTGQCLLADGLACTANAQCEHVCRSARCSPVGQANESCDESLDCATALVCRNTGDGLRCATPLAQGSQCARTSDCAGGLSCLDVTGAGSYCVAETGMSCVYMLGGATQCASGVCACGTSCDARLGVCQ